MHVGTSVIFQNPGQRLTDREVYEGNVRLADLAEPLGFESIWTAEHHFTDYTMCPNPAQFLTYMAGRTRTARLGTMVMVLPWHHPVRVAEELSVLDHLSGGRAILGIGRGIGKVEFDRFQVDMNESRERFIEIATCVIEGLETGVLEHDGKYIKQIPSPIRPLPLRSFKGRTYASAVSPESMRIMAELGLGILIIPQKSWDDTVADVASYSAIFEDVNGCRAPAPISAGWVFCDEDPVRARELAQKYIGDYYESVLAHYDFGAHMKTISGYEYYGKFHDTIKKRGEQKMIDFFVDLHVWGTPKQCLDKIVHLHEKVNNSGFLGIFGYADMSFAEAERNMKLFAAEVMPSLKRIGDARGIDAAPAQHLPGRLAVA
ncbi:LLM class flavin-dependent oxidoreductase [Chelatococcus reniformis]|uniref:Luciferase n=1 Tax=Chelatococcus reniformis TaxID=1494448 RepID=A0A916XP59_9HYPH|nr:LLM class flavin-dependent oxidoreductase [Chelatococcus reniformis]GGC91903.1 luciferase [Chelatococcus reniformis]